MLQVFEELCGAWKAKGSLQDAPQQLVDLAELMQTYGFATPGWGSSNPIKDAASPPQVSLAS